MQYITLEIGLRSNKIDTRDNAWIIQISDKTMTEKSTQVLINHKNEHVDFSKYVS